jgi:acetolactate decarboxylase
MKTFQHLPKDNNNSAIDGIKSERLLTVSGESNMIKSIEFISIVAVLALGAILVPGSAAFSSDTMFQTSTISALMQGVYDGNTTFKELSSYGDFGLGTVQALDGEMIGLDGQFYQVKSDGIAYHLNDSMKTPFAEVTFFKPDETIELNGTDNLTQLESYVDGRLVTKNLFYAIRIDGTFDYVKTRSVPVQSKPYVPLSEAIKAQKIFEFHNITGTIVGFRCPAYVNGVNVPGYHMHFITANRSAGGHLLDFRLGNASIKVDDLSEFEMVLPNIQEFYKADLSGNEQATVKTVESNPKK